MMSFVDTSEQAILGETTKREARRQRSVEEKRRIVEETLAAGASVARVARRHTVNANQIFIGARSIAKGLGKDPSSKLLPLTLSDSTCGAHGLMGRTEERKNERLRH